MTPLLLFSYLGFESGNSAAGEMKNPARDVPIAIARSASIAAAAYLLPIFAILLVMPADDITGIGGLMEAVQDRVRRVRLRRPGHADVDRRRLRRSS